MIAGVGALWLGLLMAAAGQPTTLPATPPAAPEAAPPTNSVVAVRRPPAGDAVLGEAGSRLRSELAAMGLEGQFVDCPPTETDSGACPDTAATTTISLARQDDGIVEIGVRTILPDGLELSRHIRVLARDGGDDPAVLAVRAVELLRDLRLTARRPAPPRPGGPARDDEEPKLPPPPPLPPRWNVSTGLALFGSPRGDQPGVDPAFGLAIGAGAIIGPRLTVVATVAGPFNSSLRSNGGQPAALVQDLGILELRFRLPLGPVEPFASVLTGVNYLKATLDTITSAWVPMFGVGGGVSWSLWKQFYFCFDAATFVTEPDMLVYINNMVAGRTGAPSILVSSSAGLTLP